MPQVLVNGLIPTVRHCWHRHGDLFQLRFPGGLDLVFAAHPDAAERVLRSNRDNYYKGRIYDEFRLLAGDGLITSEGELWRRQRRLINPAFRRERIHAATATIARHVDAMLERWEQKARAGVRFDLAREMQLLMMHIVGETLLGVDLSDHTSESVAAFADALAVLGKRGATSLPLPLSIPTPANVRLRRAISTLDRIVHGIIARARESEATAEQRTFVHALVAARDEDTGEAMSDRQIRDEVITMYLAGHETTANTLSWTFHALADQPEYVKRLTAEADAVLDDDAPRPDQVAALKLTRMILDESLRMYPPVWSIPRTVREPDTLLGWRIPAGAQIQLPTFIIHRHPAFWDEPDRFRPERFDPDHPDEQRTRYAYMPFSLGPRTCIGNHLAMYQAKIIVARIARRFSVRPLLYGDVPVKTTLMMRPRDGVPVYVRSRRDGAG